MAKENDDLQEQNNVSSSTNSDQITITTTADTSATAATASSDNPNNNGGIQTEKRNKLPSVNDNNDLSPITTTATSACGKLNDLVADLNEITVKRPSVLPEGFRDCTNVRATVGPIYCESGSISHKHEFLHNNQPTSCAPSTQTPHVPQQPTQNSSFSFKHFLNSSTMTAPSTTVTSLDPVCASTSSGAASISHNCKNPLQTSTGARPKVPQLTSISNTSISSLTSTNSLGVNVNSFDATTAATKMKRSPRFSSFDSQASLAEYASSSTYSELAEGAVGGNDVFSSTMSRDVFNSILTDDAGENDRAYVKRSFSNYDMPMPPPSPRRRIGGVSGSKDARPNRLTLNVNSSKLKLDLPFDSTGNTSTSARPNNNPVDFSLSAVAAALPDFVQDHWMDSWFAHDMHLNSPPNSPMGDFVEDLTKTAKVGIIGGNNGNGGGNNIVSSSGAGTSGGVVSSGGSSGGGGSGGGGGGGVGVGVNMPTDSGGASQMLPDFLSDGPIIHSSQRLADVAAGLPSNSIGSPDDPPMASQLSRLRIENERLQRELSETRDALNEQTRRANDLDRQIQERHRNDAENSFDNNNQRVEQSQIMKLKQDVTQLTTENETLRRENDLLREEGAVGGCGTSSCDRPFATSTATTSGRANVGRPSRTHVISRELLRAASNAESNLRQLLAGVENLRQMATDIEKSEVNVDINISPDYFTDFLDDCDDFDEYPGGHAL